MSPSPLTEFDVEQAALDWLSGVGWSVAHGSSLLLPKLVSGELWVDVSGV